MTQKTVDQQFEEMKKTAESLMEMWFPEKRVERVIQALEKFKEARSSTTSLGHTEVLDAAEEMMDLLDMMKLLDPFKEMSRVLHYRTGQPDWRKNKE